MIAFEILKNGKRLYTMGAGEVGHMQAGAMWMRMNGDNGESHEHAGFTAVAMQAIGGPASVWPHVELAVGDEITLRMIETESFDPPEQTTPFLTTDSGDGETVHISYTRGPAD